MKELSLKNCRLDQRYDIQGLLGRGSYAEIYIARDVIASLQSPHSSVVIKALNVFLQNDIDPDLERTLVENFQNEAAALDLVRHPNIISRLGHGTARDLNGTVFHYLVLEYMAGGDMQKLCRDDNMGIRRSLKYIEQVCAGLRHAHEKGVIHRDIKPHNLLLTKDRNTVKIADFGVARFSQSDSPITRVGTNIYAPPEHSPMLTGNDGVLTYTKVTPAADIYSLAKSMYAIATCETPRQFANQPIETLPEAFRKEYWADEFLRVVRKATQSDPAVRHQSIDELWIDMTELRRLAEEGELVPDERIHVSDLPQARITQGFSPMAPTSPSFETSGNLSLPYAKIAASSHPMVAPSDGFHEVESSPWPHPEIESSWPPSDQGVRQPVVEVPIEQPMPRRSKRRTIRRVAAFVASLILLGGVLYATGSLLRSTGYFPGISALTRTKTATANTDIFLRPEPSTNNDPIGLVTKNSKIRIVNSQNNWYQVDVISQGRSGASPNLTAARGWLNGKYIDIDE